MKKLLLITTLCTLLLACKKGAVSETPLNETTDTAATLLSSGNFLNGPFGTVMGKTQLYRLPNLTHTIQLENFMSDNGPDLYVYLSKEIQPVNFIELGKLKSVAGNQVYTIPAGSNVNDYPYVCIHCKQYNHLFGYALLQ